MPLKHKIFYVLFKDYDYTESGLLKFVCDFRQWTKEILKSEEGLKLFEENFVKYL